MRELEGGRNVYNSDNNKLRTRGNYTGNTAVQPVDDTLDVYMAGGVVYVLDIRCSATFLDT